MEEKIFCKECCKEISEEARIQYKGYCKSCFNDLNEIKNRNKHYNSNEENIKSTSNIYKKITILYSILFALISFISGFVFADYKDDFNFVLMIICLISDFLTTFLFYMLATIIEELKK